MAFTPSRGFVSLGRGEVFDVDRIRWRQLLRFANPGDFSRHIVTDLSELAAQVE